MPESLRLVCTPQSHPGPVASLNPAVARCCAEWIAHFQAEMSDSSDELSSILAGDKSYRNAMPPLAGQENIRDFIACTAHGILTGVILPDVGSKLLYAAQVAVVAMRNSSHENHEE